MNHLLRILVLVITIAQADFLCGQTFSVMRKYDVKTGLSDNTVRTIMQDSTGYIWLGTKDGVNCFNGIEFTKFADTVDSSNNTLINVLKLYPHIDRVNIWTATTDGLYLFNTQSKDFMLFGEKTDQGVGIVGTVNDLCYDDDGRLWIGTSRGLFVYDERKGQLRRYVKSQVEPTSIPDNQVISVFKDSSGTLWFGTRQGLARYKKASDNFAVYRLPRLTKVSHPFEINTLMETADGEIWIGTRYDGLLHLDRSDGTFTAYPVVATYQSNTWIRALFQYSPNVFFIGTEDGLFLFRQKEKTLHKLEAFGSKCIYSFSRDREGGVWVGTYFDGVYYISPQSNYIKWYYEKHKQNSLSGNAVSQFSEDPDGNLWIATENGGLNYFNPRTEEFTRYMANGSSTNVSHNNIHALLLDDHQLWIGTFSQGIDIMNLKTRSVVKNYQYNMNDSNSIPHNHIYSLYKNRHGEIFVGTMGGFCQFLPEINKFHRFDKLKDVFIYDMLEDSAGVLWIATKGDGIWRYDRGTGKFKNYKHSVSDSGSLSNNRVVRVYIDRIGQLWFCTEGGGISRYDYDSDSFVNYNYRKKLYNHVIYGILDDKDGNLWLSSNYGIIKYNPLTEESKLYTHEDGLQSNLFNFRSSLKASNGLFYFGGVEGFNCFYPDKLYTNTVKPTAVISSINLHDSSGSAETHKINISRQSEFTVDYHISSFEIGYECLSFVAPSKNCYAYRIDQVHDDWVYTDKHSVTFMDLPSGTYKFMVKVANNDGVWSDNPCFINLHIEAPFWKTTSAKIVYTFLLLFSACLLLFRYSKKQSERREREKKDMELMMEQEMYRSKIQFFTHVAHEIKTPVSLIKAPLEAIFESGAWSEETEANLSIIRQNTNRLLELIKQLLNFRKVDQEGYKLSYSEVDINSFMKDIIRRFTSFSSSVTIQTKFAQEHLIYNVDAEALTKIVSNLLTNAFKYARNEIWVSAGEAVVEGAVMLEISVGDDGPGVTETEAAKIFEPFYRSGNNSSSETGFGIGLSLVKLLVDKHGGKISVGKSSQGGFLLTIYLPKTEVTVTKLAGNRNEHEFYGHFEIYECNLLIVEDTHDMLEFLLKNLGYNYNVLGAINGKEALKILHNNTIDIIISDIVMPEMDGFELLNAVRADKMLCHLPFILLSAQSSVNSKITGLDYGADAYIEKPFSLSHIKATIDNLLKNRKVLFERFASMSNLEYGQGEIKRSDFEWLEQVNEIIIRNFTNESFTVDTLASEMALSRSNLQRKLKGVTGLPPIDYIRLVRLKSAAQFLKEGKYRVNEVCYLVGFSNHSYFARCFQKQFGVLPKDYMKGS